MRCLEGIVKEVTVGPDAALRFYGQLLEADPSNSVCPSTFVSFPFARSLRRGARMLKRPYGNDKSLC